MLPRWWSSSGYREHGRRFRRRQDAEPHQHRAGTFGYGWQFQNFFDVSQLGAITTKGCAAEPWPGNPAPRMAEIPGGMINSVGLQNPGVAAFARESGPWLEQLSKDGCPGHLSGCRPLR